MPNNAIMVVNAPSFLRRMRKLRKYNEALSVIAEQKIREFENRNNHKRLGVHKLKGDLSGKYSFSVTNKVRVAFKWADGQNTAWLLDIDDHDMYR